MRRNTPTLKRISAILVALMLLLTSVSTVFADNCTHMDENDKSLAGGWESNGDVTHTSYCKACGEPVQTGSCQSLNGKTCYMCKGSMTAEPKCDHEPEITSNNNGTHTLKCECGKVNKTVDCDLSGDCKCECGYVEHIAGSWKSLGNGTHNSPCPCGKKFTDPSPCYSISDPTKCYMCKGDIPQPEPEPECEHEWKGVSNVGDEDTHNVVCRDCKEVLGTESHKFVNGVCACGAIYVEDEPEHECTMDELVPISDTQHQFKCECGKFVGPAMNHSDPHGTGVCNCGYEFPKAEPECEHEWKGVSNVGNEATHNVVCRDCLEILGTESHKFVNGVCACGAIYSEPECEHEWKGVSYKDEATHTVVCRDCLEVLDTESHKFVNGVCACGAIYSEPECKHEWKGVTMIDGATHKVVCRDCLETLTVESHKFVNGICACGAIYVEEECKHEWKGVSYKDEATHTIVCRDCLEVLGVESHKYVNNMPCACGAIYSEPECEHEWKGVILKDEATHYIVCRDCLEILSVESHKFVDGRPCACGKIYIEPECEHEWKGVILKDEASHYIVCRDCLKTLGVESHKFVNNMPCACGKIYIEEHVCDFEAGITSNEDGTHNINCECGEFVTVKCLDNDGDGKCDSCGYVKYEECKHEWKGVILKDDASHYIVCRDCLETLGVESHKFVNNMPCACGKIYIHDHTFEAGVVCNNDGTHTIKCECGEFVTVKCNDADGDRFCDSCCYELYPEITDEPTDEPTDAPTDEPTDVPTEEPTDKPEEKDEEETDVPKTGDARADMMMNMLVMAIALMGAALVSAVAYIKTGKNRR